MTRALRFLLRHPSSSAAAVVMAALGIAGLALALALTDALAWRPLPFPGARNVVVVHATRTTDRASDGRRLDWSYPRLAYVRERATTLEQLVAWRPATFTVTGAAQPQRVAGEFITRDYFTLLGVGPIVGRSLTAAEDDVGAPGLVALVSARFQTRRAQEGAPVVPGSTLQLNGHTVTVIGIAPVGFHGLTGNADLWVPMSAAPLLSYPEFLTTNQDFITLLARPREGPALTAVEAEVSALAQAAHRAVPADEDEAEGRVAGMVVPLGEARVRDAGRRGATLLLAGSSVLFLLTVANLVALLLGHALAQRRETAVRLALGATRGRAAMLLAGQGLALTGAGALLALGAIALGLQLNGPIDPLGGLGRAFFHPFSAVTLGWRLVGWWAVATFVASLCVAIGPAWWGARRARLDDLREGGRGSASTGVSLRRPGVAAAILVLESALAVVLVAAAGQLFESWRRMGTAPVGVDPAGVLTFELQPSETAVPPERAAGFIDAVLEAVRGVPGVLAASVDGGAPLAGSASTRLHIVGTADDPVVGPPLVLRHYVGPEHFASLGIPVRRGRPFAPTDRAGAPRVVVISESAARTLFPGRDAIGQRVWFDGSTMTSPDSSGEIVGIVGDVKYDPLLGERTMASFYTPYAQFTYGSRVYFVKVAGDPQAMVRPITAAVARVAPDLPLLNVRPLADVLSSTRDAPRRAAFGSATLALLGVWLALGGIWAVVSHATAQRGREMAIRVAHGATPGAVQRLVLRDALAWPAAGIAVGAVATVAASGVLRALLYGVTPGDARIVAIAGAGFLVTAAAACLWPAWRAARTDPVATLRAD